MDLNNKINLLNLLYYIYSIQGWFILGIITGFILRDFINPKNREPQ
ncbi:MAG: hypothetical protein KA146_06205 [Leptospiraceae bacterium]|nr:hypothetical protein [Leptospiraceae bacterium]